MKAAPDKSCFFVTLVKLFGDIIEGTTITLLNSRILVIVKLQPQSNKKKIHELMKCNCFLGKNVYLMQVYLRKFYKLLRQQNNFEWTLEHQKRIDETKTLLTDQNSNTIPD